MYSMRRFERKVHDPELIAAMLDLFDTAYIGLFDEKYPYVVPLNFGYELKDNKLIIYVHCAPEGYKVTLIEKNPNVCATFSKFSNFPGRPYKGHIHDYRSVMAFGIISKIDRKKEAHRFGHAIRCMLKQYDRGPTEYDPARVPIMEMYAIECEWDDVYGKSELPVRTVADVPFADVYNLPLDDKEDDVSDLLSKKQNL